VPEYTYKCRLCTHEFSVRKPISEARNEECCPLCGGETGKVFSAPALGGSSSSCAPSSSGGG
jgi:putative FmdB family regulatory protein